MTKNIDERKYKLIREIMELDNESILSRIEEQLASIKADNDLWSKVIKPVKNSITIEQMITEQNYQSIDRDSFFASVNVLEITESIEELLSMLD